VGLLETFENEKKCVERWVWFFMLIKAICDSKNMKKNWILKTPDFLEQGSV